MIRVYHNDQFLTYMQKVYIAQEEKKLGKCTIHHAATVDTDTLQGAYQLTNNIDRAWTENPEVNATGLSARSTSVGDVLERGSKYYVVEPEGFRELTAEEICDITFHIA